MAPVKGINGVRRFMAVLQTLNELNGATVSELADAVGIPRGAVNRYVVSLHDLGYIYRDERDKKYRPTAKTFALSKGAAREQRMKVAVRPLMRQATQKIGWSLNFTTIKHAQLMILAHTDLESPLVSESREISSMRPLLGRAAAHVLLAQMPDAVRTDLLNIASEKDSELYDRAGLMQKSVVATIDEARRAGFAHAMVPGTDMLSLAVPVPSGEPIIFALSVSVDARIVSTSELVTSFLRPLQSCANAIARRIHDLDTERWLPTAPRVRQTPDRKNLHAEHPTA